MYLKKKKNPRFPGDYPCGRDVMTVISDMSRRSLSLLNATLTQNQTTTNTTTGSSAAPDTPSAAPSASARPTGADSAPMLTRSRTGPWAFLADLEEHEDSKRIVGGLDVSPGEIPWQVGGGRDPIVAGGAQDGLVPTLIPTVYRVVSLREIPQPCIAC